MCVSFLFGDRYLGVCATDRREILHDGRVMFRSSDNSSPLSVTISVGTSNQGQERGLGWIIFGRTYLENSSSSVTMSIRT